MKLTASVRSQEDLLLFQQTLAENVAKNGWSLVAILDALLQSSDHLINVYLLHFAVLASVLLFLIERPTLDPKGLSGDITDPAGAAQDGYVIASRRTNCALADCNGV